METLISTSRTVPVSGSVLIDKRKAMELIDQLRLSIPREVLAAEEVLAQKDNIVNQAQLDARHTKTKAEDEFRSRLDQNELVTTAEIRAEYTVKDAEQRASRMLQQSNSEARALHAETDAYTLRSLRTLERELTNIIGSVRKGIDLIAEQATVGNNGHTSAG